MRLLTADEYFLVYGGDTEDKPQLECPAECRWEDISFKVSYSKENGWTVYIDWTACQFKDLLVDSYEWARAATTDVFEWYFNNVGQQQDPLSAEERQFIQQVVQQQYEAMLQEAVLQEEIMLMMYGQSNPGCCWY